MPGSSIVRLECEELGALEITQANGYLVTAFDPGSPEVRAVTSPRINADGEDDRTALTGSRAVTFTVACFAPDDGSLSRRAVSKRLRAFASPRYRPSLVFTEDDGIEQRVVVRGEPPTWPATPDGTSLIMQMAFKAPSGLLENAAVIEVTVTAATSPEAGLKLPTTLPHTFPTSTVTGTVEVRNGDVYNADADHITQMWGPATGPRLVNVTTGGVLSLPGVVLSADQYVEVDTRNATIRLNGRSAEPLYSYQEWGVSEFWQLAPGVNAIRYAPVSFSGNARAVITFRPAAT